MFSKIKIFLDSIKFEHTVFALPFAYLGMIMAGRSWAPFGVFIWVTLAMVGARTTAMLLNRIIDLKLDARNPRTSRRPTVTGEVSLLAAWIGVAVSSGLFFFAAFMLNPLCFKLSPIALILLTGYSYVKRFSFLCHAVLGLVLSMAPIGGWLAVTGVFSWTPVLLSLAVLFWVAGFDIIYALQDLNFDKNNGLHSIPVTYGEEKSLKISAICHGLTLLFLVLFGIVTHLGWVYWTGLVIASLLLKVEHKIVSDGEPDKINTAFFMINGWIGVLLFLFTFLEIFR